MKWGGGREGKGGMEGAETTKKRFHLNHRGRRGKNRENGTRMKEDRV